MKQLLLLTQQLVLGMAPGSDILSDGHQVANRVGLIENGGNRAPDPHRCAIGQDSLVLNDATFTGASGMVEQVEHVGNVIDVQQILDS
jgi:hypothetical protein